MTTSTYAKKRLKVETINSGFTRFNAVATSLKSLDPNYSSKNHVRKILCALPLKWRAKVTAIEEAKDLATLPLDELIGNLKDYETILGGDGVASKPIKEKVMPMALKANITRGQTSSNSTFQEESDEDEYINLMAKNFGKLYQKCVKKYDNFNICKEKTKGELLVFLSEKINLVILDLRISLKKYAAKILERESMPNCYSYKTTVDTGSKLGADGTPFSDLTLYRSLVGALQYLTFTRHDLSYAVAPLDVLLQVIGFPWQQSWSSNRQYTSSRSNAEAEYRGVANAATETSWLRNLLLELQCALHSATIFYFDNVSALYLSYNLVQHLCTKHIEIDIQFVRDLLLDKIAFCMFRHVISMPRFSLRDFHRILHGPIQIMLHTQ
nr:hypothetical protein [Tanacetum cinerariifolium]